VAIEEIRAGARASTQQERGYLFADSIRSAFEDLPQSPHVVATSLNTVRLDIVL
jgi:hypothetical protein